MSGMKWQVSGNTDIGGSNENQDEMFIWEKKEAGICVIGVLDGHGREVGKLAAVSAKCFLVNYFEKYFSELLTIPYECLVRAHIEAHIHIKEAFKSSLQHKGWEVLEYKDYLLKRRAINPCSNTGSGNVGTPSSGWQCVHGGTSCSLIAVVGEHVYTANIGDSSATLCVANCGIVPPDAQGVSGGLMVTPVLLSPSTDLIFVGDSDCHSVRNKDMSDSTSMSSSSLSACTDVESVNSSICSMARSDSQVNVHFSGNALIGSTTHSSSVGSFTELTSLTSSVFTAVQQHADSVAPPRLCGKMEEALRKHRAGVGMQMSSSDGVRTNQCLGVATLVVTAEHSPESPAEYLRLCAARSEDLHYTHPPVSNTSNNCSSMTDVTFGPMETLPVPELLVVYDESNVQDKGKCPRIFSLDQQTQQLAITNNGRYYKNVRKEWASLVATPPAAKFHDALAFTRSLGDFHLHTYGVSQYPEVQCVDLGAVMRRHKVNNMIPIACVVLASGTLFPIILFMLNIVISFVLLT